MDGEIDDAAGLGDGGVEVLARVMGGGDGDVGLVGGFEDGLAHAAGFSSDEEVWHVGSWEREVGSGKLIVES